MGIAVGALYTALTHGVFMTHMTREDLRATQILLAQSEALRLCGWDKLGSNGWVPRAFTARYDPQGGTPGPVYQCSILLTNAPMAASYGNNLKEARIQVVWRTGNVTRRRELDTFIARYGLQTYVD